MAIEFPSCKMKKFRDLLYNNMHTVNNTIMYT